MPCAPRGARGAVGRSPNHPCGRSGAGPHSAAERLRPVRAVAGGGPPV